MSSVLDPHGVLGILEPGNIDLFHRPKVRYGRKYASIRSITVTDDRGRAILIPTVVGKKVVSNAAAINHWRKTGQHLGVFVNEQIANHYAELLHRQQAELHGGG